MVYIQLEPIIGNQLFVDNMTSKLLQFALKRSAVSEPSELLAPASDSDEITQRLEAELAQFAEPLDENESKKKAPSMVTLRNPLPKEDSRLLPMPNFDGINRNSQTQFVHQTKVIGDSGKTSEANNNNKITGKHDHPAGTIRAPADTSFDTQPIQAKTQEQIDKEAANPIMKKDENTKLWKCDECGTKLKARFTLEMHINTKHKHVKAFSCTLCDHKSAQRANLNVHMMATHNQTEKFQCNICQKMLDGKRDIGNHIKSEHGRTSSPSLFTSVYVTFIEP